jgi:hypothetical protein
MGYRFVRMVGAWWPAAWIVMIGAWKTAEFASSMAGDSRDWLLRAMAGLLFFGPFIAAEMLPLETGSFLQKLTKTLLFSYLTVALLMQALNSTRTRVNDGMERERLARLQEKVSLYEQRQLQTLDSIYVRLLHENGCITKDNRSRDAIGCDTRRHLREDVLNTPKTFWMTPPSTDAFRELLRARLVHLDKLVRNLPIDLRVLETGPNFDLAVPDRSTSEILAWTAHNYSQERAQVLIAQFCRSIMLLILTLVIGIWYHATAEERKKFLK